MLIYSLITSQQTYRNYYNNADKQNILVHDLQTWHIVFLLC